MSSRRRKGEGRDGDVENGGVHTIENLSRRDKSNEVNGGFMQTGAFISLLTGQVPSSVSTPSPPSSLASPSLSSALC